MHILKYITTGMIGLSVNLGVFHMFYGFGVPYLAGSVTALFVAMLAGFILQKYWTFQDHSSERMHIQFALYAALALGNLAVNTLIVFLLVEYAGAHYLIAQTIGAGLVAFTSYLVYKHYIFAETLS
jgi:putative flippase GtrA